MVGDVLLLSTADSFLVSREKGKGACRGSTIIRDKGVISLMTQKENIWPRNFKASPHSGRWFISNFEF